MLTSSGIKMAGIPSPTPGSAEGTEIEDDQSKIPPSAHTPGSAEGEDDSRSPENAAPKGQTSARLP